MKLDKMQCEPNYGDWKEPFPNFQTLLIEYQQCIDEGKDVEKYKDLFYAVNALPDSKEKAQLADTIYSLIETLPQRDGYKYNEPDDLEEILKLTNKYEIKLEVPERKELLNRVRGAWYGRICGCVLGKPIECMGCDEITEMLKRTGNYPMHRYISFDDVDNNDFSDMSFPVRDRIHMFTPGDGAPGDDDTNYIVLGYKIIEQHGHDFSSDDVLDSWVNLQSINAYGTAERIAYKNSIGGFRAPETALYQNPYREWIGAQIRGDFYGWINPANPKKAAEMAWTDARISHVKNGIYGEMWVSAMLAAAAGGASAIDTIRVGLGYVPKTSRFYEAVSKVVSDFESGVTEEEFFTEFHKRWDFRNQHHMVHTVSNAEIVAAALLYGNNDYGRTVCITVENGFDTDCNAATAGSVIGMIVGADNISDEWKNAIKGTLYTSIAGSSKVSVDEMSEKTLDFINHNK